MARHSLQRASGGAGMGGDLGVGLLGDGPQKKIEVGNGPCTRPLNI